MQRAAVPRSFPVRYARWRAAGSGRPLFSHCTDIAVFEVGTSRSPQLCSYKMRIKRLARACPSGATNSIESIPNLRQSLYFFIIQFLKAFELDSPRRHLKILAFASHSGIRFKALNSLFESFQMEREHTGQFAGALVNPFLQIIDVGSCALLKRTRCSSNLRQTLMHLVEVFRFSTVLDLFRTGRADNKTDTDCSKYTTTTAQSKHTVILHSHDIR
jgi:hypothetical protein